MIMRKHIIHNFSFYIHKKNTKDLWDEKILNIKLIWRELHFLSLINERWHEKYEGKKNKFVSNFFFSETKENTPKLKDEYNTWST